jgi:hypothetical protein
MKRRTKYDFGSQDEDKEFFDWLAEHGVTVREIDDRDFREKVFNGIRRKDSARRFEVHITDLIYCLRAAWFQKVLPQEYSEGEFEKVWHWMRGTGIEIGTVAALRNVIEERLTYQKRVSIGGAIGSIDILMDDIPYELTTAIFYGSKKKPKVYPPSGKVMQDVGYMVAQHNQRGRVKVYIMLPPKEERTIRKPGLNANVVQTFSRPERTWELSASLRGALFFRNLFRQRGDILKGALDTGNFSILPCAYFPWRCKKCSVPHPLDDDEYFVGEKLTICEYMELFADELREEWQNYRKEKENYIKAELHRLSTKKQEN